MRSHDRQMRALTYRLMGDSQLMDDVLQDAYIKAYRSLHQFEVDDDRAQFGTWLYRVVYSVCIDDHRKQARRPSLQIVDDNAMTSGDPADSVLDAMVIRSAMSELSQDHAAVIALVDGEGYSYDEVAAILETSPGTVASRLSRARSAMRTHVRAFRDQQHQRPQNQRPQNQRPAPMTEGETA